jgi:outer membrane autotransporter protein
MNKIYRCVWNQSLGAWVAAAENVRSRGKSSGARAGALLAPAALALGLAVGLAEDAQAACVAGSCTGTYTLDVDTIGVFDNVSWFFNDDVVVNVNVDYGITTGSQDMSAHDNAVINAEVMAAIKGENDYYGRYYPVIALNDDSVINANAYASIWNATVRLYGQSTFNINYEDATSTGLNIDFWTADTSLNLNGHNTTVSGVHSQNLGAGRISNGGSSDAELYINRNTDDSVFSGTIEDGGTGKLSIRIGGDHTFTGHNTYSGGTKFEYGDVTGYGYSFGSGDIDFEDSYDLLTLLSDNTTDSDVMSNNIIGDGELIKKGLGSLTLTGNNTFTLGMAIEEGDLIANANSLGTGKVGIYQGSTLTVTTAAGSGTTDMVADIYIDPYDPLTGGDLIFNPVAGTEINVTSSSLDSISDIEKNGLGTVTLQNNYAKNFNINAGTLNLRSQVNNIQVNSGGTLAGPGTAQDVNVASGGTIHPGLGRLNVDNLTFDAGSTYVVTATDSEGHGSAILVNNTAKLNNAAVRVEAERSTWNTERVYTILSANNLEGTFSGLSANFAYLTPSLAYNNDQVELTLVRNSWDDEPDDGGSAGGGSGGGSGGSTGPRPGSTFASLAQSANQRGVANSVEGLPSNHQVYQHVLTLPAGAPAATFNSLSGEAHASLLSGLPDVSAHAARLPLVNLRHSLNAGLNPVAMTAQVGGTLGSSGLPATNDKPAWVQLVGNWQDVDGDSNAGDLKQHSGGVFVGLDREVSHGWHLGGSFGYTRTNADVSSRSSDADIDSYSATLYGGKAYALDTQRQLNLMAGLAYTYHDIDSERQVYGLEQKLTADYGAHTTQLFGEVGYLIGQPEGRYVEPFAGLTLSYLDSESFTERGGSAALRSQSEDDTQVVSSLGVRAQTDYRLGNTPALLRGSLAWQHAFGDERMERTMAFRDGSDPFSVKGVNLARDTAVVGIGTQMNISPAAAVSLDYEGKFASGLSDHGASLKVQWDF